MACRTEFRAELNQNDPCRKYPSTGPPSGRPSAVTRGAAIQEPLQGTEFFLSLEHQPITPPGYDIPERPGRLVSWPRCAAGETG